MRQQNRNRSHPHRRRKGPRRISEADPLSRKIAPQNEPSSGLRVQVIEIRSRRRHLGANWLAWCGVPVFAEFTVNPFRGPDILQMVTAGI